ncbi:hypothetical protein Q7A53_20610 [Halobacillus rhizosphaerae]|uniref:hypothetical protein n=1 Tax=Halobacillus rhizosphaerae TaxID=3064889 RepID=UPI00398AA998
MKNKTIDILLIVFILAIFISYFLIKQTVWAQVRIEENIHQIEHFAALHEWDQAEKLAEQTKEDWDHYQFIIIFNYGETDFTLFEEALEHISAGSKAKDLDEVVAYTQISYDLWKNFNRLIPEP